jgi:predicted trehalose synthase
LPRSDRAGVDGRQAVEREQEIHCPECARLRRLWFQAKQYRMVLLFSGRHFLRQHLDMKYGDTAADKRCYAERAYICVGGRHWALLAGDRMAADGASSATSSPLRMATSFVCSSESSWMRTIAELRRLSSERRKDRRERSCSAMEGLGRAGRSRGRTVRRCKELEIKSKCFASSCPSSTLDRRDDTTSHTSYPAEAVDWVLSWMLKM